MKTLTTFRTGIFGAAAAVLLLTSACAGGAPDGGSNIDGIDRSAMTIALETALSSKNAKASWNGNHLTLAVDGDATVTVAGFTECMVLSQLLEKTDTYEIKFPNGTVQCKDVLPD